MRVGVYVYNGGAREMIENSKPTSISYMKNANGTFGLVVLLPPALCQEGVA